MDHLIDDSNRLKPCPFCGAGETQMRENGRVWGGKAYGEPSSVSVVHWCVKVDGQPSRVLERVGRDKHSAIEAWNRRAALSSNHEDGRAVTDKESLTAAPVALGGEPPCNPHPDAPHGYNRNASHNAGRYVCDCEGWAAMGGEKGEAVAQVVLGCDGEPELRPTLMVERMHEKWDLEQFDFIYPHRAPHRIATLYEGPVGKARMLTDLEITRCWEATFGYLELGIAIQHKFCEKNGIEVLS